MPLWIERVLKYARLESANRLSVKKALETYDDVKKDYECYDDIDAIHFLIMLNSLVPRPSIMRREGLVSTACACAIFPYTLP